MKIYYNIPAHVVFVSLDSVLAGQLQLVLEATRFPLQVEHEDTVQVEQNEL